MLGWGLGYLRFPQLERNSSFWVGFATCLAVALLLLSLLAIWNRNALLLRILGKRQPPQDAPAPARVYTAIWIMVALCMVLSASVSSWMIYQQQVWLESNAQHQRQKAREQMELTASVRNSSQIFLMGDFLDHVGDELEQNPNRTLRDATIARIAALSHSFQPYRNLAGDSLSSLRLSPERGQLLLALSILDMDSTTFDRIKLGTPFSEADLGGASLKGADLRGANLKGANLRGANLEGAHLQGADLRDASLWGANLNHAHLEGATLIRADMRWAELNSAVLNAANLDGVDLSNAKMRKADLEGATFRWGNAGGALLHETNLTAVDMIGTSLARTQLGRANLSKANLRMVVLTDARFDKTDLTQARVGQESWEKVLEEWRLADPQEIQAMYQVVKDTARKYGANFLLESK